MHPNDPIPFPLPTEPFSLAFCLTQHPYVADFAITSSVAPVQVEGQLTDGRWFYLRHRHSLSQLGLGESPEEALDSTLRPDTCYRDYCIHAKVTGLCSAPECAWGAFRIGLYSHFGVRSQKIESSITHGLDGGIFPLDHDVENPSNWTWGCTCGWEERGFPTYAAAEEDWAAHVRIATEKGAQS